MAVGTDPQGTVYRDSANPTHLEDPMFDHCGRMYDWRNHIGSRTRAMWQSFTPEQKLAIAGDAYDEASNEDWDRF